MTLWTALAAVMIAVGLVGVVVPLLPGLLLVWAGVLVWAVALGEPVGWSVLGVATVLVLIGSVVKYLVPGRRMQAAGVPGLTLFAGAALGVIGFFVVPIVGLPLGFVLGVYLAELGRVGSAQAWPSTVQALKAVGLSMLIEFVTGLLVTVAWIGGVLAS
ncbi:DUF456 domain-containing protein [Spongisporangium articulatum]|uniref:DUF456 domain-containing protein n=1 Tax=Spongisporangium articulatum TaxID=3362603 RepID=A0ABW8AN74_9ACTN